MSMFRKAFLYVVGAVAVAYEEATKAVKKQRQKMAKTIAKA